jgi:hypothetical protein
MKTASILLKVLISELDATCYRPIFSRPHAGEPLPSETSRREQSGHAVSPLGAAVYYRLARVVGEGTNIR